MISDTDLASIPDPDLRDRIRAYRDQTELRLQEASEVIKSLTNSGYATVLTNNSKFSQKGYSYLRFLSGITNEELHEKIASIESLGTCPTVLQVATRFVVLGVPWNLACEMDIRNDVIYVGEGAEMGSLQDLVVTRPDHRVG